MSGDQQWPAYEPSDRGEPSRPVTPPRTGPSRKPVTTTTSRSAGTRPPGQVAAFVVVGFVVLLVGFLSVLIYLGSRDTGFGDVDALSAEGLAELTADVEERTGRTEVFDLGLYPTYAVVRVTVDATSQREDSLQWDGDLEEFGGKGTSSNARLDLADIDIEVVLDAVETAKTLVENPETWSAYVTDDGDGPTVRATASNEYSEYGTVEVTLDGTEIRRSEP